MHSKAKSVKQYLQQLPPDRREAILTVRETVLKNLPKGYEEVMQYGMIGYVVPLKIYPQGYLGRKDVPLPFAGLASQKNHMALYLMSVYGNKELEGWFKKEYKASGKKLDMGKSCIRFKKLEDLPLDVIAKTIAKVRVEKFVELYESSRRK